MAFLPELNQLLLHHVLLPHNVVHKNTLRKQALTPSLEHDVLPGRAEYCEVVERHNYPNTSDLLPIRQPNPALRISADKAVKE